MRKIISNIPENVSSPQFIRRLVSKPDSTEQLNMAQQKEFVC